jgi:hypothetical protein
MRDDPTKAGRQFVIERQPPTPLPPPRNTMPMVLNADVDDDLAPMDAQHDAVTAGATDTGALEHTIHTMPVGVGR